MSCLNLDSGTCIPHHALLPASKESCRQSPWWFYYKSNKLINNWDVTKGHQDSQAEFPTPRHPRCQKITTDYHSVEWEGPGTASLCRCGPRDAPPAGAGHRGLGLDREFPWGESKCSLLIFLKVFLLIFTFPSFPDLWTLYQTYPLNISEQQAKLAGISLYHHTGE